MPPLDPRVPGSDPMMGAVLDGRYRVVEQLGQGGMSMVYLAEPTEGGPAVAIKMLHDHLVSDADQKERFEREARALFGLDHPNILKVHDFGLTRGMPYLVMERLEGRTLDMLLEQGPLSPHAAVDIARQVLEGLAFAHAQGALHRDLKAENVFVAADSSGKMAVKLLDFGLVKFVDDDRWGEGKQLTEFGEVFGTPAYMSPEQCTGAPADTRSDVYAMGVLVFELLTGTWPFVEGTRVDMMRAHMMTPAPTLAETHSGLVPRPELEALVATALMKNRDDRYRDAGAMLAALDAIPKPVATAQPSERPPTDHKKRSDENLPITAAPKSAHPPDRSGLLLVILMLIVGAGVVVVILAVVLSLLLLG